MQIRKTIKNNRLSFLLFYPMIKVYRNYKVRKFQEDHDKLHGLLKNAKAGILTFRVPAFKGDFDINVHSDLSCRLLLHKEYETKTVHILEKYIKADKDIIDVGANIGFFSVFFARSINDNRKVLAVEPTPGAFGLLKSNIAKNECDDKVIIFNGVASNSTGEIDINVIAGMEEYSSIGKLAHTAVAEIQGTSIKVPSETLDNLVAKYKLEPGLIKIDVEGAEYLVLQGGKETILKYSPAFLIEVSDQLSKSLKTTSVMLFKFLQNQGYKIVSIDGSKIEIGEGSQFNGDILAVKE